MNLLFLFLGTVLGTLVGMMPGVGTSTSIVLLLPVTFSLDPLGSPIVL